MHSFYRPAGGPGCVGSNRLAHTVAISRGKNRKLRTANGTEGGLMKKWRRQTKEALSGPAIGVRSSRTGRGVPEAGRPGGRDETRLSERSSSLPGSKDRTAHEPLALGLAPRRTA